MLIGVTDEGGLVDAAAWNEERAMNVARTLIDPPIVPTYQRLRWDEQTTVAVVGVEPGVEKPYALRTGEGRRYFTRVGSTSREAGRDELIRLTQFSGAVAGDLRPVLGAKPEDLEPDLLAARFAGRRTLDWRSLNEVGRRQILTQAEILHPETGGPTVAGLLCFAKAPQQRLAYAYLSCVSYPGTIVSRELLDRTQALGRVEEQVEAASEFVERNLTASSMVSGLRRAEARRPSVESLREVLVNAVAHRHYGIAGPGQVRVFPDRVEVLSPGSPPNGVTPASMRVGVSAHRNEFILQHLLVRGLMDALGRGIPLLYEEAAALGLPEPNIVADEHWTTVVLYRGGVESVGA